MNLADSAARVLFDLHYLTTLNLTQALSELRPDDKRVKVYFTHQLTPGENTACEVTFKGEAIEFWELSDGCLFPATLDPIPEVLLYDLPRIGSKIAGTFDTHHYLRKHRHGTFVDRFTLDYFNKLDQIGSTSHDLTVIDNDKHRFQPCQKLNYRRSVYKILDEFQSERFNI